MAARIWTAGPGLAVVLLATLICFDGVLFRGGQFGFRDAGHHFYPLHQIAQAEWRAGRIPLWNPWENGGVPLLGNPTAAVLYPGKLLFAVLPFEWATRIYVIGHVVLAAISMWLLARQRGADAAGAWIAALAYAFGGPVLLLHSNVIFLAGAAWLPWAICCIERWVERRRVTSLLGLALILALMTLGGDPQTAYLVVVAGLIRVGLTPHLVPPPSNLAGVRKPWWIVAAVGVIAVCAAGAVAAPAAREAVSGVPYLATALKVCGIGLACLLALAPKSGLSGFPRDSADPRRKLLVGLLGAAALGLLLAAVQVLPTLEFVRDSSRGAKGINFDRYGFSLVPYRLVELVWPGLLGVDLPRNASWRSLLPPEGDRTSWVASLYVGGPTIVLAIASLINRPTRSRVWLAGLAVAAVVLSFGYYAGPLGIVRWLPALGRWLPGTDLELGTSAETDFRAGDGSPYWLLTIVLPGFDLFRYPSKLLPWVAFAVALLAAEGWSDLATNARRRLVTIAASVSGASLGLWAVSCLFGPGWIEAAVRDGRASPLTGPFDAQHALALTRQGLIHAACVFGLFAALAAGAGRFPRACAWCVVLLLGIDLVVAHRRLVWSVPQEVFEQPSAAVTAIREAERRDPSEGPFRIHRPTFWHPLAWFRESSGDRAAEIVAWERKTLQPLYAAPERLSYTLTLGILESERYLRQFYPWTLPIGAALGQTVRLPDDTPVLHFPRRAFDLWGARYLVLPVDPGTWRDENRGYASFLDNIDVIAPDIQALGRAGKMDAWRESEDWQVFRNRGAFPRAWVVYEARVIAPLDTLPAGQQTERLRGLLYAGDALWNEPGRPVLDPRRVALVESGAGDRRLALEIPPADAPETLKVTRYEPQRVEIEVELAARGLVVLADADAPGWQLEVDGRPQPIWRANLGMRGAIVDKGHHVITYMYVSTTFKFGAGLTALGLVILMACGIATWRCAAGRALAEVCEPIARL
jgi:hypothetical protein